METCKTCGYWKTPLVLSPIYGGICTRYAPRPQIGPWEDPPEHNVYRVLWPLTFPQEGCSEWTAKKED